MHTAFCPTLLSSFPLIWLRLFNHCNLAFFLWWKFIRVCGIFWHYNSNISLWTVRCLCLVVLYVVARWLLDTWIP
jgi:hypothetical protein